MFHCNLIVSKLAGSVLTLSCLFLSACSGGELAPKEAAEGSVDIVENWGPPEHTHINFTSQTDKKCPSEEMGVFYIDPIPKLVELARNHNVVMINEAHYKPLHRAFTGELARALTNLDFNHFGAEAFSPWAFSDDNRNQALVERGYPVVQDGSSLIKEPIFGQLLETVLENDYTLFAYEVSKPLPEGAQSSQAHRDTEQAKNILNELGDDTDKKILIHAGYDHIREVPTEFSDTKWMAEYFTEMSGIDPLTINQTDCYSQQAYDAGLFGYAMPVDIDGNPISSEGYDVILIPPKEAQFKERPVWLRDIGRSFVDVPAELKFEDQYTRVTARNVQRGKDAVVEDTIYRSPHSDKPLALRPGTYRLEVMNKDKALLGWTNIIVR